MAAKWTEALVIDALREKYLPAANSLKTEEWAFLTQVPLRCTREGYPADAVMNSWTANERTIDVLLVRNWSGGKYGHERLAIEVKVTRADYRNETPAKRAPAEASAQRCAYAAPAGVIDPATLPDGWGLIEVGDDGALTWRKSAKRRTPTVDVNYLTSAGFRRASRAEEKIRRGESAAAEIVVLRAEVESLRGVALRATEARDREMLRAKAARAELLVLAGQSGCSTCGQPLTWLRGGRYEGLWEHKDRSHERVCSPLREAAFWEAHRAGLNPRSRSYPEPATLTTDEEDTADEGTVLSR